ncbi:MAG: GGDEF domain-containing protein, partial [Ornithinibacter sp.]
VALARWMQGMQRIRREAEGIRTLAFTDALTGVGNRHAFASFLGTLTSAQILDVAVLIVDVDDLKAVNDLRGHRAGDSVLKTLAGVLTSHARNEDLVVRMGGDEFAVVAGNLTIDNASQLAHRIVAAAAGALAGVATVSVGVSTGSAASIEDVLLRTADEAMYAAKRSGGGAVRLSMPTVASPPPITYAAAAVERVTRIELA